ncbi:MAG TPA: ergothioneine biosynthesis protein EgtB [Actinomycetota bacterium]|nr:ergothioneine biosynthesis protein EgtB [Actinomycetota bacterium]
MELKQSLANELEGVRRRSFSLLEPVADEDLMKQLSPIMSPLVWDLAHVGNYEEIWLLRMVAGVPAANPELDDIYDAFKHARKERTKLRLLPPEAARGYITEIRGQVFDVLEAVELDPSNALLKDGFVYGMVVQHEHQHDETMLATLQLRARQYPTKELPTPAGRAIPVREVLIEGGIFQMGTDLEPWAYDNERPAHTVDLDAFWIDTYPVTNAEYMAFIAAGGYDDPRHWSSEGWEWRQKEQAFAPMNWRRSGNAWSRNRFGKVEPVPPEEPVQHVCWHEACAYASWVGKRLPTEAEWEVAATWDPGTSRKRRYPWGDSEPTDARANIGERRYHPAPVGAYPRGINPFGCHQMIGDVWEWTSSDFLPYPGFNSFPYREYSEVFYGHDYKVLRGGSWATHATVIRGTFRNWDFPIRRQIFAGFRCARDA